MTPEQQRAIVLARVRARLRQNQEAEQAAQPPPPPAPNARWQRGMFGAGGEGSGSVAPPSRAEAGELARYSMQRRQMDRMVPGFGVIVGPISRSITDPDRRAAAGRSFQGFVRDVQALPSLDYGRLARDTGAAINEGVRNLPQTAAAIAQNLPAIVRGATYGPIEDEELAQQRLDLSRLRGDPEAIMREAGGANAQALQSGINVAAPLVAGPTPSLLRTAAVAGAATAPTAFSGDEPLQERIPRGVVQTAGGATLGAGLQAGISAVARPVARAVNSIRQRRFQENQSALENQRLEADIAPMTQGERSGNLSLQGREQRFRYGMGGSEESQRTMSQFDVERSRALQDRVLTGIVERGGRATPRAGEPIPGDLESAGNDLLTSLRSQRREMLENASSQYDDTYARLRNEPVTQTGNMSVVDEIRATLEHPDVAVPYDVLPANTRARLAQLQQMLENGRAVSQATLENTRQRLNEDMGAALRQGGMQEADMRAVLAAFDDWRSSTVFDGPVQQLREAGVTTEAAEAFREAVRGATRARDISRITPLIDDFERNLTGQHPAIRTLRDRVEIARDLEEARAMYHEAQNLFGRQAKPRLSTDFDADVGRRDVSLLERLRDAEITGERAMRQLFGNFRGSLPEGTLATIQKIRRLGTQRISTSDATASGRVRTPGRMAYGAGDDPSRLNTNLTRARRFVADAPDQPWAQRPVDGQTGVQLPTPELQATRRGFSRVLLEEMDDYLTRAGTGDPGKAGLAPFRQLATKFDRALTGEGRRVTELLFTEGEIAQLEQTRQWLHRVSPPAGTAPVSSPMAVAALWDGVKTGLSRIPIFGEIIAEIAVRSRATRQAAEAVKPVRRVRPMAAPRPLRSPVAPGLAAGVLARPAWENYTDEDLERIARAR